MKVSNGFEIINYLHVCHNPSLMKMVEHEYFSNRYISRLFKITKDFDAKYGKIPFDVNEPSLEQIKSLMDNDESIYQFDEDEGNIDDGDLRKKFLNNVKNIISHSYSKYDPKYISTSFNSWVSWSKFESSVNTALDFVKGQQITPENANEIINSAMQIFQRGGHVDMDEESYSFWDAEVHKQPEPGEVLSTGNKYFDNFCSKHGGLLIGEIAVLIGATSIGKSIVLLNIVKGLSMNGFNVAFASLEMSENASAERLGANMFDINMDEYAITSEDEVNMQGIIDDYKKSHSGKPIGEILLKQFHKATPKQLDGWVLSEEKKRDIKINALVVDYLGEMGNDHGTGQGTPYEIYMFHKQNTQDLSSNAILNKYGVFTAHQNKDISKEANDMDMDNIGESKGLTHKPGVIIGLLQPPHIKADGKFFMKSMKGRDSKLLNHFIEFDIDYSRMRLTEEALHPEGQSPIM